MFKRIATLAVVAVASLGLANPGSPESETSTVETSSPQLVETMTDVAGTTASRIHFCYLVRMCR